MKAKVSLKDNSSWLPKNIMYDDVDLLFMPTKELIKMYLQLQSNWNSLRELIEKFNFVSEFGTNRTYIPSDVILDKMNELEGEDNENN